MDVDVDVIVDHHQGTDQDDLLPGVNARLVAAATNVNMADAVRATSSAASTLGLESSFATALIEPPLGAFSQQFGCETAKKLGSLCQDQTKEIENLPEDHWRTPEFPLARIKKIMRMDEDVKMISGEVPILFSKAIEMFVTELTLRAWLQTRDVKRRTVQRSDIAMAIAKNDMFDFLIDIVPREEIQNKPKLNLNLFGTSTSPSGSRASQTEQGSGDLTQLLQPEVLHTYLQMLSQQSEEDGGGNDSSLAVTSTLLQQQVQLLQQLISLQQQMQKQNQEDELEQEHIEQLTEQRHSLNKRQQQQQQQHKQQQQQQQQQKELISLQQHHQQQQKDGRQGNSRLQVTIVPPSQLMESSPTDLLTTVPLQPSSSSSYTATTASATRPPVSVEDMFVAVPTSLKDDEVLQPEQFASSGDKNTEQLQLFKTTLGLQSLSSLEFQSTGEHSSRL